MPFVNCCQFMYLVISLLVLRARCGIWLNQCLIIAHLFTYNQKKWQTVHTCHISHCEIKSLWNLAHQEANSHKNFQISQNFQTILKHTLWRNNHISHFVVFITSFIHSNEGFWQFWGSFKLIFVKISEFYQIFLKNLPYLTNFSPQLMACMQTIFRNLYHAMSK